MELLPWLRRNNRDLILLDLGKSHAALGVDVNLRHSDFNKWPVYNSGFRAGSMRRPPYAKKNLAKKSSICYFKIAILCFAVSMIGSFASFAQGVSNLNPIVVHGTAPGCSAGQVYLVNESTPSGTGCASIGGGEPPGGSSGDRGGGGGGGKQTSNNSQKITTTNPDKSKNPCADSRGLGDPIIPSTGNKVEAITDFSTPGEMGLNFTRHYISRNVHGSTVEGGWTDNLDYELHYRCLAENPAYCTTVTFMRPDGSLITFKDALIY